MKDFLKGEGFPQPIGFGNQDVTLNKPRLFSDVYCLHYLNIMSIYGTQGYSAAITTSSSRHDTLQYFTECNSASIDFVFARKNSYKKRGCIFVYR
ncbi:DUF3231 family protein [Bacillus sp. EB600]|nr:DUF3231 family protein [Bacillus sp. EB600]